MMSLVHVIGGGLAGSEAAWQLAKAGVPVTLHEMRPVRPTEAHLTDKLAELVCSNSFRSDDAENNAVGLLHEEMRRARSLIIAAADANQVPAGGALAVDREGFPDAVEAALTDVKATVPAEFSQAFDEFDLLDQVVVVFTILAVFAGGIGVMNTMLMSVFERTREIGILQAIGWSKAMIVRQVIVEGLIVCLLAGPVGIGMGVVGLLLISSIGDLGWVAGDYGPSVFVLAFGVAVGMGMVGAIYPALRAVRITPIEALRYE